jgi:hypothetical protein
VLIYGDFSTGKLGFGTLDPLVKLDVDGGMTRLRGGLIVGNASVGVGGVHIYEDDSTPELRLTNARGFGGALITFHEATSSAWQWDFRVGEDFAIRDGIANERRLLIDSEGDVGIGTISPERKLHIVGANPRILIEAETVNPEVNLKHSGDAGTDVWAIYKEGITEDLRFYQGGNKLAIEGSTGNVRIGTDTPQTYKLYVQGTAYATGGWQPSDRRYKQDLKGIGDALDQVVKLRGVLFKWRTEEYPDKGFPEGGHYGVIAQEVEDVLPEVVTEGADGEKAVAYTEIIPVLIEAIKTQQRQIELLEARIADLEK